MNKHLYFAYGLNTNIDSMTLRCPNAKNLGAAILPKHSFEFSYCANIVPANDHVEGVLWEITDSCLASLDMLEGYPNYYNRKTTITLHDGKQKEALVYFMVGNPLYYPPSDVYFDACLQGYRDNDINILQLLHAIEDLDE